MVSPGEVRREGADKVGEVTDSTHHGLNVGLLGGKEVSSRVASKAVGSSNQIRKVAVERLMSASVKDNNIT